MWAAPIKRTPNGGRAPLDEASAMRFARSSQWEAPAPLFRGGERSRAHSRSAIPQIALVAITVSWGSSLCLQKLISTQIGPVFFNTTRCAAALLALALIFWPSVRLLNRRQIASCLGTGAVLGLAIMLQSLALAQTKANVCGFISGLPVVITPLLAFLLLGERASASSLVGVVLAAIGVVLISTNDALGLQPGDLVALLASVTLAFHIVLTGRLAKTIDPRAIATLQMAGATAVCALACPFEARGISGVSGGAWLAIAYLGVMNLGLATLSQSWAQQRCSATRTGIILTLEPVFGAVFAWWLLGETLCAKALLGGTAIVLAMMLPLIPAVFAELSAGAVAARRRIRRRAMPRGGAAGAGDTEPAWLAAR